MIFACCDENRKAAVLNHPAGINGIDYLEVLDRAAIAIPSLRQRTLLVYCLRDVPANLTPANVRITGGESITGITAEWIAPASAPPAQATAAEVAYFTALPNATRILVIRTSQWGDFSPYTLRLVNDAAAAAEDSFTVTETLSGFDPLLAEVTFSFKVQCGPEFDCAPAPDNCPPADLTPPPINYLAKDYSSFRQVMLDRLSQLVPSWSPGTEADIGMMLTEVIAYAGDQLSYRQDAVTTEAYLNTARSRVSLRRHARLVDYHVHEGCNARAWMHIEVTQPTFLDRKLTRFYTTAPSMPKSLEVGAGNEQAAITAGVVAFEPMQDANLYPEQNQVSFYTWGDTNCCLAKGATEATLKGTLSHLQVGDVLIFKEALGPQTGNPADADIRHRCAVRLTAVTVVDASGNPLVDPLFDVNGDAITSAAQQPQPATEIQWSKDDALPFPVCVSSHIVEDGVDRILTDVSVALGNNVLADHGLTFPAVNMGTVPEPALSYAPSASADHCEIPNKQWLPVRFRPVVPQAPLTQAVALPPSSSPSVSASGLMSFDASVAIPAITLTAQLNGAALPGDWTAASDLLAAGPEDAEFVVEVDSDGSAILRFGGGANGRQPESGTTFFATYRIGNGAAGNVGADSLIHSSAGPAANAKILACTNPMPGTGGIEPETNAQIRRRASQAYRTQERAVTRQDYVDIMERNPQIENAAASLRWTGSWYTAFIAAEPDNNAPMTNTLRRSLTRLANQYRLAGEDVLIEPPQYVPLTIALSVCVSPDYFRRDVQKALMQVLGSGSLPSGQAALFNPCKFQLGQPVYLSLIYRAARQVAGVQSVTANVFEPQGMNTRIYLQQGYIPMGPFQVARMDNDPSLPANGRLQLTMAGGK